MANFTPHCALLTAEDTCIAHLKVYATCSSTSHTPYMAPRLVWTMLLLGRNITVCRLNQPFLYIPLLSLRIRLHYSPFYRSIISPLASLSNVTTPFLPSFCCCCKFVVFTVLVLEGKILLECGTGVLMCWGPHAAVCIAVLRAFGRTLILIRAMHPRS